MVRNPKQKKEEAIKAGERAPDSLRLSLKGLKSAKRWSVLGDLLTTHIKHKKLSQAETDLRKAKIEIGNHAEELADVQSIAELCIGPEDYVKTADYIDDESRSAQFLVLREIKSSIAKVEDAIEQVEKAVEKLKSQLVQEGAENT